MSHREDARKRVKEIMSIWIDHDRCEHKCTPAADDACLDTAVEEIMDVIDDECADARNDALDDNYYAFRAP